MLVHIKIDSTLYYMLIHLEKSLKRTGCIKFLMIGCVNIVVDSCSHQLRTIRRIKFINNSYTFIKCLLWINCIFLITKILDFSYQKVVTFVLNIRKKNNWNKLQYTICIVILRSKVDLKINLYLKLWFKQVSLI